jgi:hypothetical protein
MFRPLLFLALLAALAPFACGQSVSVVSISRNVDLLASSGSYNLSTGVGSITSLGAITSRVRSTARPWSLDVRATSSTFSHAPLAGATSTTKSISNLLIRENGSSAFTPVSTSDVVVSTGRSTTGGGVDVNLDVQFATSLSDSPGSYAATLIFTIITL